MGHHLIETTDGGFVFQSDKHPELPPDRIRLNLGNIRSYRALMQLADDYEEVDNDLAVDLRKRLSVLHPDQHDWPGLAGTPPYVVCKKCRAQLHLKRWTDGANQLHVRATAPYPLPTCGK